MRPCAIFPTTEQVSSQNMSIIQSKTCQNELIPSSVALLYLSRTFVRGIVMEDLIASDIKTDLYVSNGTKTSG